jgi:hypothetical protein
LERTVKKSDQIDEKKESDDEIKCNGKELDVNLDIKGKAVPLHAMEALGGRGGIASTHSRPRH